LFTDRCKSFLKPLSGNTIRIAVLYVDIVGSTKMTMYLSTQELEFVIKLFWEQISLTIEKHGGLVFKYVGDAVIAVFDNNNDMACRRAIECGQDIVSSIKNSINSELIKKGIPRISIKLGIDYGDALVVSFGNNVDLIGFSLSIVSKITSIASANIVLIGECIFEQLSRMQGFAKELHPSDYHVMKWNGIGNIQGHIIYRIYSLVQP
ncbi:MAG TPA: adenylate/guanylate cyclase domain-containing protein, partial [Nitrososphaeraceae archaeon]|nr:adenylate/guanylate cyclase domain-containing protein [Nitrososphaeraceae archaeon]